MGCGQVEGIGAEGGRGVAAPEVREATVGAQGVLRRWRWSAKERGDTFGCRGAAVLGCLVRRSVGFRGQVWACWRATSPGGWWWALDPSRCRAPWGLARLKADGQRGGAEVWSEVRRGVSTVIRGVVLGRWRQIRNGRFLAGLWIVVQSGLTRVFMKYGWVPTFSGGGRIYFPGAGRWRRGVAGVVKSDVVLDSGVRCGRGV